MKSHDLRKRAIANCERTKAELKVAKARGATRGTAGPISGRDGKRPHVAEGLNTEWHTIARGQHWKPGPIARVLGAKRRNGQGG
jgi:hypothetical protein